MKHDMVNFIGEERVNEIFQAHKLSSEDEKVALDILSEWSKQSGKRMTHKVKIDIIFALGDIVREYVDKKELMPPK